MILLDNFYNLCVSHYRQNSESIANTYNQYIYFQNAHLFALHCHAYQLIHIKTCAFDN